LNFGNGFQLTFALNISFILSIPEVSSSVGILDKNSVIFPHFKATVIQGIIHNPAKILSTQVFSILKLESTNQED
jgi:hypothetical protein